jgi:hypothetical protein
MPGPSSLALVSLQFLVLTVLQKLALKIISQPNCGRF